ncbi:hypothetical protein M7I_2658 [Glarea lozoyensis 74030]|uniref:C2H2-type domain-containing protein n=1 Tax=Glarea lozoyensis (strain ATCC 74030 / MF5533) TaxID=1104152 RepID=H0EJD2_GLAL7|nr:hypothetical protein M7I_2658 [Glarea lozoyensis 74030]
MASVGKDSEMLDVSAPSGRDTSEENDASRVNGEAHQMNGRITNVSSISPQTNNGTQNIATSPSMSRSGRTPSQSIKSGSNGQRNGIKEEDNNVSPSKAAAKNVRFHKEVARLQEIVDDVSPEAARTVLHAKWRRFIFEDYDEFHISFVLRAVLKNANLEVLERVARDGGLFKGPMLQAAVENKVVINSIVSDTDHVPLLAKHMSPEELFSALPEAFIDKAVAGRIATVESRQLVTWLASAGRLGYRNDDLIGVDERVAPNPANAPPAALSKGEEMEALEVINALGTPAFPMRPAPHVPQPLPPTDLRQPMVCQLCKKSFTSLSGYNYHTFKGICEKVAPATGWKWVCEYCLQGFTTKQGREYHNLKHVCENSEIQPPSDPSMESPQLGKNNTPRSTPRPPIRTSSSSGSISKIRRQSTDQPTGFQQDFAPSVPLNGHLHSGSSTPLNKTTVFNDLGAESSTPPSSGSRKQRSDRDVRHPPEDLPPEKLAAMNREIDEEDARHRALQEEILKLPQEEQEQRLQSAKNGNASKKSTIRKRYGVTLRLREKDKIAAGTKKGTSSKLRTSLSANPETLTPRNYIPPAPPANISFMPINTIVAAPPPATFSPVNAGRVFEPPPRINNGWINPPPPMPYPYGAPHNQPYIPDSRPPPYPQHLPASSSPRASVGSSPKAKTPKTQKPVNYAPQHQQTAASYAVNNKRRRSDSQSGDEGSARPSPAYRTPYEPIPLPDDDAVQLQMQEVSSQPAAAKFPKKFLAESQPTSEVNDTAEPVSGDTTMIDAPAAGVNAAFAAGASTNDDLVPTTENPSNEPKKEPIVELSDSDSDDGDIPNDNS